MADEDLNWWFRAPRGGVASGGSALPPAMPGQSPRMPPPVSSPLSTVTGTPAFQLGYPLIAGLVSGLFPNRGGRAIAGLSAGLNTANYYNQLQRQDQELAKQEEEKRVLGDKLGNYLSATKFTGAPKLDMNQMLAEPANPETAFSNIEPPTNVAPVIPDSPRKRLAQALIEAGQPTAALKFMEAEKERTPLNVGPSHTVVDPETYEPRFTAPGLPQAPFGSPETGYYERAAPGEMPRQLVPGQPKPEIPFGSAEAGFYARPAPGEEARQIVPPQPKQPTPLHPLQEQNIRSQMGARAAENKEREARINKITNLTKTATDPKATAGQLSSAYNALLRERDSAETPEKDKLELNQAIRGIRNRLAELGKQPGGPAQAGPPPGAKPIGKTKDGKTVYQTPDGKKVVQE